MITFDKIENFLTSTNGEVKKLTVSKEAIEALTTDAVTGKSSGAKNIVYFSQNFGKIEIESEA